MKFSYRPPIIGTIFDIFNSYAYRGSTFSSKKVAPLKFWFSRFSASIITAIFLSVISVEISTYLTIEFIPQDISLSIFPSILGFGIGAFALLFSIPESVIDFIEEKKEKGEIEFDTRILIADMAFPLTIYFIILFVSSFLKSFGSQFYYLDYISAYLLFYGLLITLELIYSIFNTSKLIMNKKISSSKERRMAKIKEPSKKWYQN